MSTRPKFEVSPPAQHEFRVLGGQRPAGEAAIARAALDHARAARDKRDAKRVKDAAKRARDRQLTPPESDQD